MKKLFGNDLLHRFAKYFITFPYYLSFSYPRHLLKSSLILTCLYLTKSILYPNHFHIRDIRRIRHIIPLFTATALTNSLFSNKLDYWNSIYSGISQTNPNKLQHIPNVLALGITITSQYKHITPTVKQLHWLPISQRINYNICLLTYKTLINQQPTYYYSLSCPSHSDSTRSSDSLVLSNPYVRTSLGRMAFSVIGPRLWNALPTDTRNSSSLALFHSRLNTHFQNCVPLGSSPSPFTWLSNRILILAIHILCPIEWHSVLVTELWKFIIIITIIIDTSQDMSHATILIVYLLTCCLLFVPKNYVYAGLQYRDQCYCGNTYGGLGPATNCNMACSGNSRQMCGGSSSNTIVKCESFSGWNLIIFMICRY